LGAEGVQHKLQRQQIKLLLRWRRRPYRILLALNLKKW